MYFLKWITLLLVSISLTNCRQNRKQVIVQGDVESAIRHFNDTTREQLYIEKENDSTPLVVHGKHWYKPSDSPSNLIVFLDRRPITISRLAFQPDGSFSFHLGSFKNIMRHTLLVTQNKSETERKQSQISFYILEHESGKEMED
jgi:hypothetical protein